jgi:predicted CoA-binding protein
MNKTTLVIGASSKPERYAFKAIEKLRNNHHSVYGMSLKPGRAADVEFDTDRPAYENLHTVTLYIGARHQPDYYDYILSLKPKRVIFNPGTENQEFHKLLEKTGIEAVEACTLVLLGTGQY